MTSKIFKSIVTVAITILISCIFIITGVLYQYFGNVQQSQLKGELRLAASATEKLGIQYLENLNYDKYRITWVDSEGNVLFDSHAELQEMDNHGDREEIKEALVSGTGSSTRHSTTLTEETIYEATRLEDGSVLRISVSRATALVLVLGMLQPITVIVILAIALSAWLAHRMSKRIVEPLNKLNLEAPLENDAYEELSPLLHRIHAQHQEIAKQLNILKRKQDEFNQITRNMKEALVLLDHNDKIININPAALKLFGTDTRCIGEHLLSVDRKQDMREALNETHKNGVASFRSKFNELEYQFELSRIDTDDKVHGMVILAFDVTEQLNAEKHRREFTANVSHELKTPLQSIMGSAELIENGIVKEDDLPRFVGHIRKEASRLVVLVDDIIRLSQLDEGGEMPFEDVSLRVIAQEVCETLSDAAKIKGVSLEVRGDDGIVNGVRRLLYEVVYNLCDNAIKYNKTDGCVTIDIHETPNKVCISVADNGIGIAPEYQDKIFERFYRVDKSHSKQSGGTGLGLSIVKHAVKHHNGKIAVDSKLGKGTTISVEFSRNK